MKSLFKVGGINKSADVATIKQAIAAFQGVVACEISRDKGEVSIIYDDYFVKEDEFIGSIEELGYIVL